MANERCRVVRQTIDAEDAFLALGINRSTGYAAIKAGTFPLPVIRVGRRVLISRAALDQLLGGHPDRPGRLDGDAA